MSGKPHNGTFAKKWSHDRSVSQRNAWSDEEACNDVRIFWLAAKIFAASGKAMFSRGFGPENIRR